jgi:hypothetical protein
MDLGKLRTLGVGAKEIGRHYVFFNEFMSKRLGPGDDTRVMTVLDIGGLGLGNLNKDVLDVLRTTSEVSRPRPALLPPSSVRAPRGSCQSG